MALSHILLKTAQKTVLPTILATTYYIYFIQDNGHYYNQSYYKRVNDKVNNILSHQHDSPRHKYNHLYLTNTESQLFISNNRELYKDIWNRQILKLWNCINSI
ncbi:Aim5p [Monosporozyma unispora]|nr:Aim5p [Kazachstania unispora]